MWQRVWKVLMLVLHPGPCSSGVVMQGQVFVPVGRLSPWVARWGWDAARSRRRMWEGKKTLVTRHTNKSWDECDIPTDRMLLEMYTYKRQTAHHAYWLQMAKIESFLSFFLFCISYPHPMCLRCKVRQGFFFFFKYTFFNLMCDCLSLKQAHDYATRPAPKQYLWDITIPPLLLILNRYAVLQNGHGSSPESFPRYAM